MARPEPSVAGSACARAHITDLSTKVAPFCARPSPPPSRSTHLRRTCGPPQAKKFSPIGQKPRNSEENGTLLDHQIRPLYARHIGWLSAYIHHHRSQRARQMGVSSHVMSWVGTHMWAGTHMRGMRIHTRRQGRMRAARHRIEACTHLQGPWPWMDPLSSIFRPVNDDEGGIIQRV